LHLPPNKPLCIPNRRRSTSAPTRAPCLPRQRGTNHASAAPLVDVSWFSVLITRALSPPTCGSRAHARGNRHVLFRRVRGDRPTANPPLRKKLWLSVARKVISQTDGIKAAIDFLARCDLLRIEDLIPFFPDFVVIDDFRDEICAALEGYGRSIDLLKKEMDESSQTAANIKTDIAALHQRYAIVEPGEKCYACALPLLSRQFFVFPCQHSFHSDCLARSVLEHVGPGTARRIRDLQAAISKGIGGASGPRRDAMIEELDSLVASACILCSDFAIKRIDEPFITKDDDLSAWAL
jgi:hypothetical protein